jgi:hypothetical protein
MQRFSILKQLVHIVTTVLQGLSNLFHKTIFYGNPKVTGPLEENDTL